MASDEEKLTDMNFLPEEPRPDVYYMEYNDEEVN